MIQMEHSLQMIQLLPLVPAGDKDVFNLHKDKGKFLQDTIHHMLEGLACITQPNVLLNCQKLNFLGIYSVY